jgi:hypothetical protein
LFISKSTFASLAITSVMLKALSFVLIKLLMFTLFALLMLSNFVQGLWDSLLAIVYLVLSI